MTRLTAAPMRALPRSSAYRGSEAGETVGTPRSEFEGTLELGTWGGGGVVVTRSDAPSVSIAA